MLPTVGFEAALGCGVGSICLAGPDCSDFGGPSLETSFTVVFEASFEAPSLEAKVDSKVETGSGCEVLGDFGLSASPSPCGEGFDDDVAPGRDICADMIAGSTGAPGTVG